MNNIAIATVQKTNPTNKEEEKKKFFFDPHYNPQFVYAQSPTQGELVGYGLPESHVYEQAKKIMDTVIQKWGTESAFLDDVEGKVIERETATQRIREYLRMNRLEDKVLLKFSSTFAARTSVTKYTINIRIPIDYRTSSLEGILNHEIGTHIYRRLNDDMQPWSRSREQYGLHPYMETEEGLAVLHNYLAIKSPYLWLQSVRYYATTRAQELSFSELYEDLKKYIDSKDRRWNTCLRAKRGLQDTSLPGGYTKDMLYLQGAQKVGRWLLENNHNLAELYFGKIALEDVNRISLLSPGYVPLLPAFYKSDPEDYGRKIATIIKLNKLL